MSEPIVTISGQRVYPRGQVPEPGGQSASPDLRDQGGRPVSLTEMSPNGWASGSSEETFEAGLPFLGGLVGVIVLTLLVLLLANRSRRPSPEVA
jgi:hypothetical protein